MCMTNFMTAQQWIKDGSMGYIMRQGKPGIHIYKWKLKANWDKTGERRKKGVREGEREKKKEGLQFNEVRWFVIYG